MDKKIITSSKSPVFLPKPEPKSKKEMNFGEAMQAIVKGKNITKKEWKDKKWYAYLYKKEMIVVLSDPYGALHSWTISEGDITGTDYIEV